jgi:TolA-binding protein
MEGIFIALCLAAAIGFCWLLFTWIRNLERNTTGENYADEPLFLKVERLTNGLTNGLREIYDRVPQTNYGNVIERTQQLEKQIGALVGRVQELEQKLSEASQRLEEKTLQFEQQQEELRRSSEEAIKRVSQEIAKSSYMPAMDPNVADAQAQEVQKFEQTQNAQFHVINREWMMEKQIFQEAVGFVSSMYRDLGQDSLPEEAIKQLEKRVSDNMNQLFRVADEQRAARNAEVNRGLIPPPPPEPIDPRDAMALDELP